MKAYKEFEDIEGNSQRRAFETTDTCPSCHKLIEPIILHGFICTSQNFSVFNYCKGCDNTFISKYGFIPKKTTYNHAEYFETVFLESVPLKFEERRFDQRIKSLSERFVQIFNQSFNAESIGLYEIAGCGYRKALEILVKDYSISFFPDKKDVISAPGFTLSSCIKDYINDNEIKSLATAVSWLGNDEVHYTRKHTEKDLGDLLSFLDATVNFIAYKLAANDAISFIAKSN